MPVQPDWRKLAGLVVAAVAAAFLARGVVVSASGMLGNVLVPRPAPGQAASAQAGPVSAGASAGRNGVRAETRAVSVGEHREDPFAPVDGAVGVWGGGRSPSRSGSPAAPSLPAGSMLLPPPPPEPAAAGVSVPVPLPPASPAGGTAGPGAGLVRPGKERAGGPGEARGSGSSGDGKSGRVASPASPSPSPGPEVVAYVRGPVGCSVLVSAGGKTEVIMLDDGAEQAGGGPGCAQPAGAGK